MGRNGYNCTIDNYRKPNLTYHTSLTPVFLNHLEHTTKTALFAGMSRLNSKPSSF